MNYIKKIKSIGFKKCKNIVVCRYISRSSSPNKEDRSLFKALSYKMKIISLDQINDKSEIVYPKCSTSELNKLQTYIYKVNYETQIYLMIIREDFTVIVKKNEEIKATVNSKKLSESFWKETLSTLDKDIQRDILLKDIFSYK